MRNQSSEEKTDNIVRHFILAGIFLFNGLAKIFSLILSAQNKENNITKTKSSRSLDDNQILLTKSTEELKEVLQGLDIISNLNKDQLLEIYKSSPEAIDKLFLKEKKDYLMQMKNDELRKILKGMPKLTKYKKAELVEIIISKQNSKS